MAIGKNYLNRSPGKKSVHFTGNKVMMAEAEISILIDVLEYATENIGRSKKSGLRESRIKNYIEDFRLIMRKLIFERKELRKNKQESKSIELFRIQIKTLKAAIEIFKENEEVKQISYSTIIDGIYLNLKEGVSEIRARNAVKRERSSK